MFIESVIALMLLSLAVFAVPVRWKWQVAFCVVGLGVLSALYEAVGVFSGGGRIYPEGINIVFGPQYGVTDPLSSFFLIILSLSAVAVLIYAKGYIKPYLGRKSPAQISLHYCGLGILYLSMLLVVTLRDGFSFLFAWEVMTLSSFVLMLFDAERREVRRAALSYLMWVFCSCWRDSSRCMRAACLHRSMRWRSTVNRVETSSRCSSYSSSVSE